MKKEEIKKLFDTQEVLTEEVKNISLNLFGGLDKKNGKQVIGYCERQRVLEKQFKFFRWVAGSLTTILTAAIGKLFLNGK